MRPGKCKALDKTTKLGALTDEIERLKASIRAKGEHPFRVIKRQFGFSKVRYRGQKKNTARITTLFALSNRRMDRRELRRLAACTRPNSAARARNGSLARRIAEATRIMALKRRVSITNRLCSTGCRLRQPVVQSIACGLFPYHVEISLPLWSSIIRGR